MFFWSCMSITCRALKAKDSLDYRKLRLESLLLYPDSFGANYQEQVNLEKLYVEELLEQGSNSIVMLGAFINNELIGLCGLKSNNVKQLEIIQMYVATKFRGRNVGQLLLQSAKMALKKLGAEALILIVYVNNMVALQAYKNSGFKLISSKNKEITMIFEA